MDDIKHGGRQVRDDAKKAGRGADGEDLGDKVANLGDDVRRNLGNAGDDLRHTGRDVQGDARRQGRDADDVDASDVPR